MDDVLPVVAIDQHREQIDVQVTQVRDVLQEAKELRQARPADDLDGEFGQGEKTATMGRSSHRVGKSSVRAEFADWAYVGRVGRAWTIEGGARAWRSAAALAKQLTGERRTLVDRRRVRRDCIERDWASSTRHRSAAACRSRSDSWLD